MHIYFLIDRMIDSIESSPFLFYISISLFFLIFKYICAQKFSFRQILEKKGSFFLKPPELVLSFGTSPLIKFKACKRKIHCFNDKEKLEQNLNISEMSDLQKQELLRRRRELLQAINPHKSHLFTTAPVPLRARDRDQDELA